MPLAVLGVVLVRVLRARFDRPVVGAWKDSLKQLRLDRATGEPVTGACRFGYVLIIRQLLDHRHCVERFGLQCLILSNCFHRAFQLLV
ncbi:hypothetical protein CA13_49240 [Planctomycetes bacterium CA13]|uniref:Uncharacterized protein n=1 Tax=Novipirellula herctigrandis TaxID=2527986 RepID=A0A5C5Z7Y9_9BACT|nr:hypothetical protein CA13_49240 [Planctomycetes bacterium CA13]